MPPELHSRSRKPKSIPDVPRNDRHSKRRPEGSKRRGRLWVILCFFLLRGIDVWTCISLIANGAPLLGNTLYSAVVTSALLAGVWHRQTWCRYVLMGLLTLGVAFSVMAIPATLPDIGLNQAPHPLAKMSFAILCVSTAVHILVLCILGFSPHIKRLMSRARD